MRVNDKTKEQLIDELDRYEHIVSSSADMLALLDKKFFYLAANTAYLKAFNLTPDKLIGHTVPEVFGKGFFETVIKPNAQRCLSGEQVNYQSWIEFPAYEPKYMDVNYYPYLGRDNKVKGFVVNARDITERKKAEEALKESNLWMDNIFNSLKESVLVVTPDRVLRDVNKATEKMFGYSKDELINQSTEILHVDHDHYIEFGRIINNAFDRDEMAICEFEAKRKNGEIFPTEHTVSLLKDESDKSIGIVSIVRDVTERKKAELELETARDELEIKVKERTLELGSTIELLQSEIMDRKQAEDALLETNRFLESILDNTHMLVAYLDREFNFIRVNKAYAEADEKEPSFFPGKNHFDLFPNTENENIFRKVVESGEPFFTYTKPFEYPEHSERGVSYWDWSLVPIKSSENVVTGLVFTLMNVTERKKAEQALQEKNILFRTLIDSISDSIYYKDTQGRNVLVNKAFEDFVGMSRDEIEGKADNQLLPEDLAEYAHQSDKEVIKRVKAHAEVQQTKCEDGTVLFFDTIKSPVLDTDGNMLGIIGVSRDITKRKVADETLQESERLLSETQKSSNIGSWVWDLNTGKAVWSEQLYKIYGRNPDLGVPSIDSYLKSYHPDDRAPIQNAIEGVINKNIPYMIDYRIFREDDGEMRWIRSQGKLEKEANGKKYRLLGMAQDITERKKAERKLEDSENKLGLITDNAVDYIFIKDINRRYTFVNKAMKALLGLRGDEILGKTPDEIFGPEQGQIVKEVDDRTFSGEIVNEIKSLVIGDKEIFFNTLQTPLTMEDGNVTSIMGIVRDVSKLKKTENDLIEAKKEIEKWNMELERRVEEKTEELRKSQNLLIQSEKLSAMGKMAGGLAHELNSPLAGLVPMLELHKKRAMKGSKEDEELTLMLKAADHMAKIVKNFGVFSRKSKSEFRALSLNEVIEDTLSFSAVRLKQKGIKVKKELSTRLPLILGDKTELQQVVLNMTTNALDAMNEGDNYIIKTDISEDNNKVKMLFIDDGTGIAEENLNKIFDPFFTTKKEGEGTGLGLSVSYGIIKNHNGEILVESEPGKGTRFSIYLPTVKSNNK
ncbi:MAG: PAS domain S-box protein [Promethearchaeota archaeon]|jgi:PAS domain S-box-containing protein